ncbi:MAG TPA: ATPase, partial [Chromatiaceae bacterium]|nr:ATPase [Chromatiaceae bacterium]
MIINSVKARNVLKYASLELGEIPEKGIIAISGENESGKSSIGETICFALFGRTFSLDEHQLGKLLRWGENRCSVILEFTVDGTRYQLGRFLDRDGNHGARLALADEPENTLVRGVTGVADRLYEILGYEFDEFVESFYLAQREITTPHPHSVAVKTMAGMAPLEHVAGELEGEIAKFEEMLEEIGAEADALRQEQKELDFQEGLLVSLENHKNELEAEVAANEERLDALQAAVETYQQNYPLIRKAERKRGRSRFWRFVTFVLALVAAATWGLLSPGSDLPQSQQVLQLLQQKVPNWQDEWIPMIGWSAVLLAILMVLFWTRVSYHDRRARALKSQVAELPQAMEAARAVRPLEDAAAATVTDVDSATDQVREE